MMLIVGALAAVGFAALGGFGAWGALNGRFIAKTSPQELGEKLAPFMQVYKPDGEGPFPTVLLFPGCGGVIGVNGPVQIMPDYAKAANKAGFAAIVVDSYGPRDIEFDYAIANICSGRTFRGGERAGDVLAAITYVQTLDYVDGEKIVLAGWSHGGWSIMDLLTFDLSTETPHNISEAPADALDGVIGAYLTYPYSGFPARTSRRGWVVKPPARVVMASADLTAPVADIEAAIARMRESGVEVEDVTYADATHGFDEPDQVEGSRAIYEPERAAKAHEAFTSWLQRRLAAHNAG